MVKKYKVGIYTPNKIFLVKGKVIRSPFEAEISEKELQGIKMKIRTDGIDNYSIEEISTISIQVVNPNKEVEDIFHNIKKIKEQNDETNTTEIKIEELEMKSKSLLEKFISS